MNPVPAQDKVLVSEFLRFSAAGLAKMQAALPVAKDDGLKRILETSIANREKQIKGVQEFLLSQGIKQ